MRKGMRTRGRGERQECSRDYRSGVTAVLDRATPLSWAYPGPVALRPRLAAGLPFVCLKIAPAKTGNSFHLIRRWRLCRVALESVAACRTASGCCAVIVDIDLRVVAVFVPALFPLSCRTNTSCCFQ